MQALDRMSGLWSHIAMSETLAVVKSWVVNQENIPEEREAIAQLSMLSEFDYERLRVPAAQVLGFRVSFVDRLRKEILKER